MTKKPTNSLNQINNKIEKLEKTYFLKPGLYKRYKNMLHRVIGIARHTESQEILVVYQNLFGDFGLRTRPYDMFIKNMTIEGKTIPRFSFIKAWYEEAPPPEVSGYKPEKDLNNDI